MIKRYRFCRWAEQGELSALGQKRTLERGSSMSASPTRADMLSVGMDVG